MFISDKLAGDNDAAGPLPTLVSSMALCMLRGTMYAEVLRSSNI